MEIMLRSAMLILGDFLLVLGLWESLLWILTLLVPWRAVREFASWLVGCGCSLKAMLASLSCLAD